MRESRYDAGMKRLALAAPLALLLEACVIVPRSAGPQELFWQRLQALCGRAFPGRVTTTDPGDSQLAAARLVLHVAHCSPGSVRIAFHASRDASRVWMITRPSIISLRSDLAGIATRWAPREPRM